MLRYGCTRLEIGVQSVYEDVARDTNRGHTVRAVCETFHLAKDAGYKVVAHMMPDLPNVGVERDLEQFKARPCPPIFYSREMDNDPAFGAGVFREPRISLGRAQDLSHASHPWNGLVRALAHGQV